MFAVHKNPRQLNCKKSACRNCPALCRFCTAIMLFKFRALFPIKNCSLLEAKAKTVITVENVINAPAGKVWEYWTKPEHIIKWNNASDDWHTPRAENDLRTGGKFSSRMEAKDGSMGFDFGGVYDAVRTNEYIEYTLGDGRVVKISFIPEGSKTKVIENFEAENTHSEEMQRSGWQAILDNFKKYVEESK
jgi:uncharacterized protein YndB with AHSA1/START domain